MFAQFNSGGMLKASAIAIALFTTAGPAPAQDSRPVVVYGEPEMTNLERVPYGDLNLLASADRRTLFSRIGRAVRNVCDFDRTGITTDYRACSSGAWGGARPQISAAIARSNHLALISRPTGGAFITVTR